MGRLDGRIAFITGAARGQGRSHAQRLAREGADIIAVDLCGPIDTVQYPLPGPGELDETAALVEKEGRRAVTRLADVRDLAALQAAVADGVAELGPIDIIVANAGIASVGATEPDPAAAFRTVVEINMIGVWNTVTAAVPSMIEAGRGGSIVLTSSTQGLKATGGTGHGGMTGYTAAKHGVVGLMRSFATWLGPQSIRVNSIHPTGVNTPMVNNTASEEFFLANPAFADAAVNLMPTAMIETSDVSAAVAWLVSDEARWVTGVTLPVDAGFTVR